MSGLMTESEARSLIWVTKNEEDSEILCDSCLDDFNDEENHDDLVICEKCNAAVHQTCYGRGLHANGFPQGEWFCERCLALKE